MPGIRGPLEMTTPQGRSRGGGRRQAQKSIFFEIGTQHLSIVFEAVVIAQYFRPTDLFHRVWHHRGDADLVNQIDNERDADPIPILWVQHNAQKLYVSRCAIWSRARFGQCWVRRNWSKHNV
jgi:hypothetical protein